MSLLLGIFTFILILVSLFLVMVVLMQKSKDGGMGAALGGGAAEAAFGADTSNVLSKSTIYAAILSDRGTPSSAMLVRGNWKLIDTGSSLELYDLRKDPDEKTNLAGQRTQAVTEMRALLHTRTKAGKTDPF